MTGAKLSRQYRPTSFYRDVCRPKVFHEAFRDFKHFFQDKTQIAWDERLEGIKKDGAFVYTPPILGRPVGVVPSGYVRPEWRQQQEDVEYDTDSEVEDDDDDDDDDDENSATDGKRGTATSGSGSATSTSDEGGMTDSNGNEQTSAGHVDVLRNFNVAYGYQPGVIDGRFVEDIDLGPFAPNGAMSSLSTIDPSQPIPENILRSFQSSESIAAASGSTGTGSSQSELSRNETQSATISSNEPQNLYGSSSSSLVADVNNSVIDLTI